MDKKTQIITLLNDIKPPLFLSPIDLFQRLVIDLYVEFRYMSDDLVTAEDMFRIALPILESNITEEDIKAYQELKKDPVVCHLMAKYPVIKKAMRNGRTSQLIYNFERKVVRKDGVN
ncbi:MAG: hypothetical protein WBD99_09635 [Thermodesulfobacteriota bacterium]